MINAFTVDVEEWFHVCGVPELADPSRWEELSPRVRENTRRVLALLGATGVRATFFVVGWVAERYPDIVADMLAAGHEVGHHSHLHRRVYELDDAEFARDLRRGRAALSAAGASAVTLFRAPEWSINDRAPWAIARLAQEGFTVDSSRAPMPIVGNPAYPQVPHYIATPAGPVIEVPPAVARRFGQHMPFGGGWGLRMARPGRVLREIERRNRRGEPVTLWIHPWELDPDPPRIKLPAGKAFAHYFRLSGLADRLKVVLAGGAFSTMSTMLASARVMPSLAPADLPAAPAARPLPPRPDDGRPPAPATALRS